jgi:hypothetical protein
VIIGARFGSERLRKDQKIKSPDLSKQRISVNIEPLDLMVRPARLERATSWFVASRFP